MFDVNDEVLIYLWYMCVGYGQGYDKIELVLIFDISTIFTNNNDILRFECIENGFFFSLLYISCRLVVLLWWLMIHLIVKFSTTQRSSTH